MIGDTSLDPLHRLLERGDVVEQFTKELPLMGLHAPSQCLTQSRELLAQPPLRQFGQDLRIRLPGFDGPQHAAPTDAHHIAGHGP